MNFLRQLRLVALVAVATPAPSLSQISLAEWSEGGIDLTGYVRALGVVQDAGFDPLERDRTSGIAGNVARLKWRMTHGSSWVLDIHNRVQTTVTSSDGRSVVGFGVSAIPDRSVDLESVLVSGDGVRMTHDVDRLALTLYSDAVDLTVGRQAVTWGLSSLFPVADLWTRFSPYELDTEEKPGVDAVRALAYPSDDLEVDVVLADRGTLDDLSVGARATWTLDQGDLYVAAGKFWRQAIAILGGSRLLDEVKLRGEIALPVEVEDSDGDGDTGIDRPRATIGADWITGTWAVSGELHYNGVGAADPSEYVSTATTNPRIARGESYFLGRYYVGISASWQTTDRTTVAATGLTNVRDPSASITPAIVYDLGQNARISVGGLVSFGDRPVARDPIAPSFESEFGAYGTLGWTQLSLYF